MIDQQKCQRGHKIIENFRPYKNPTPSAGKEVDPLPWAEGACPPMIQNGYFCSYVCLRLYINAPNS